MVAPSPTQGRTVRHPAPQSEAERSEAARQARIAQLREKARQAREARASEHRGPAWTHFQKDVEGLVLRLLGLHGPVSIRSSFGPQETMTAELVSDEGESFVIPVRGAACIEALDEPSLRELVTDGGQPAICFLKIPGKSNTYWTVYIDFDGDVEALGRAMDEGAGSFEEPAE